MDIFEAYTANLLRSCLDRQQNALSGMCLRTLRWSEVSSLNLPELDLGLIQNLCRSFLLFAFPP